MNRNVLGLLVMGVFAVLAASALIGEISRTAYRTDSTESGLAAAGGSSLTEGLVGHWKFDEGSGALVADSSRNNNGSIIGATWTTSGKKSSALQFSNDPSYVEVPNSSSINLTGSAITVSAWVYPDVSGTNIIVAKPVSSSQHQSPYFSYSLHTYPGGTPRFWLTLDNQSKSVSSNFIPPAGSWYHFVGVYDGSNLKVYINGVERGSVSASGNITGYDTPLRFGTNGGLSENWKGKIDEVRIYNRALSASEVSDVYNDSQIVETPPQQSEPAKDLPPEQSTPPVSPPPTNNSGDSWYAAPSGSASGNGTINNPWDIKTALAKTGSIKAGDTLWLRGGLYDFPYNTALPVLISGTSNKPVIIRGYPGERATVIASMNVDAPYVWLWGFELANNRTRGGPDAIDFYHKAVGGKAINMVIHDMCIGVAMWNGAIGAEAYGNLIFNNGIAGSDRGHCHGIYTQNTTGTKMIHDNIIFNMFGYGMQIYGSPAVSANHYDVRGNTVFNSGSLYYTGRVDNIYIGGTQGHTRDDVVIEDNYFYQTPEVMLGQNEIGSQWDNIGDNVYARVRNNYFVGGDTGFMAYYWNNISFKNNFVFSLSTLGWIKHDAATQNPATYDWDNNTYYGNDRFWVTGGSYRKFSEWQKQMGVDKNSTFTAGWPKGVNIFVRPNKYESGRANVTVFNWDKKTAVDVNLSSVLSVGTKYEVRDAQNFYGPVVASGTYSGGSISIPMNSTSVMPPLNWTPQPHTASSFGVFVVLPLSQNATPPPVVPLPTPPITTPPPAQTPPPTAPVTKLKGDFNDDKKVDSNDFSLLRIKWGKNDSLLDLNKDGIVNSLDFSIFSKDWGKTSQ